MKECELCVRAATMHCESDQASLCWDCDARVHGANFLVARHTRTLLCRGCQSPTPWRASGASLRPTMSVCDRCSAAGCEGEKQEQETRGSSDELEEEEDDDDDDDEEEEEEDGDNQVVPWEMTLPPPASSSGSEESSSRICHRFSDRMRENADLASQNDPWCSTTLRRGHAALTAAPPPQSPTRSTSTSCSRDHGGGFPKKSQPSVSTNLDISNRRDPRAVDLVWSGSRRPPI